MIKFEKSVDSTLWMLLLTILTHKLVWLTQVRLQIRIVNQRESLWFSLTSSPDLPALPQFSQTFLHSWRRSVRVRIVLELRVVLESFDSESLCKKISQLISDVVIHMLILIPANKFNIDNSRKAIKFYLFNKFCYRGEIGRWLSKLSSSVTELHLWVAFELNDERFGSLKWVKVLNLRKMIESLKIKFSNLIPKNSQFQFRMK